MHVIVIKKTKLTVTLSGTNNSWTETSDIRSVERSERAQSVLRKSSICLWSWSLQVFHAVLHICVICFNICRSLSHRDTQPHPSVMQSDQLPTSLDCGGKDAAFKWNLKICDDSSTSSLRLWRRIGALEVASASWTVLRPSVGVK